MARTVRLGALWTVAAAAAGLALGCGAGPAAESPPAPPVAAREAPANPPAPPSPPPRLAATEGSAAVAGAKTLLAAKRQAWKPPRFPDRQTDRNAMVRVIRGYGLQDKAVLAAMAAVPRHEFVTPAYQDEAHADTPLPIGHGQTISQPYMVAEMTRLLALKGDSRVLEVGTGSGYQAAVLTEFTPYVYTIEIVKALAESAAKRLGRLGYDVVEVRPGDGYFGWAEAVEGRDPPQFDGIIVTCAAGQVPPPLLKQLKPGGRMVIPVGGRFATQTLILVEKQEDGSVRSRSLMAVRFVPLIREDPGGK